MSLITMRMPRLAARAGQQYGRILMAAQNSGRTLATTPVNRDIDSAAKYIGAGAATVGVAGSGSLSNFRF